MNVHCVQDRSALQPRIMLPRIRLGILRPFPLLLVTLLFLISAAPIWAIELSPADVQNPRCLTCHGRPDLGTKPAAERRTMVAGENPSAIAAPRPGLYIEPAMLAGSLHAKVPCIACHVDADYLPHPIKLAPAQCGTCHPTQQQEYTLSVHGKAFAAGSKQAARCPDCHGSHDIISHKNPQSRTYRLQLPFTCAKCHSNSKMMQQEHIRQPLAAQQYLDSMHGRALLIDGLIVAPTCNDCHGVHKILSASDPQSSVNRANVPNTCGKCHIGIERIYNESIHGRLLAAGDQRGPVCITCHAPHLVAPPGAEAFKLLTDERCGGCHADRLRRYRETFHGKAMALGRAGVAACYDCHGHHDIVPVSDPRSHLAGENKVETCRKCHKNANANFAGYMAHADHSDRVHYPVLYWTFIFMTCIVLGTFSFFGVHSAFWFFRSLVLFIRDPKAFKELRTTTKTGDQEYVRFRPFERFLHFLVVISFLTLVATGMPLKFYDSRWAHWMVSSLGGIEVMALMHRAAAMITFLYFGLHLASMVGVAIRRRAEFRNPATGRLSPRQILKIAFGPDMPLPNLDDLKDWWAHQMWFLGRGPRPQFDRWTYWEKFDYMAVFWGVAIIGATGLIMWFPGFFTRVLPGSVINVAMIIHSDEALLAAGFIFTFHFFNVHFRLEKFPMDPVIFSGRISKTEMLHERKRWYDRLVATNQLDKIRVRDDWAQWKRVMHPVGFIAFGIGVFLLVLIFVAMSSRLFGGH